MIGQNNTWMPLFRTDETYTHTDNISWTKGAHEFRFGFDLIRYHLNHFQPELGGGPRGEFAHLASPPGARAAVRTPERNRRDVASSRL